MYINFADIPEQNDLFLDFLYNFENVNHYYKKNFRSAEVVYNTIQELEKSNYHQREKLVAAIYNQYSSLTPSDSTTNNINLLKENTTFAIITGQQAGIVGGPLYNCYKIISAIKLAQLLKEKFPSYNFVPVFWMEVEDHDYDEIAKITIPGLNNEIRTIKCEKSTPNSTSIGKTSFDSNISNFLDTLSNSLMQTEFSESLFFNIKKAYAEGKSIKHAFKEMLFSLFDEYGLIIFDTVEPDVKSMLRSVFKKEIINYKENAKSVIEVSAKLEEEYHAQVKVRPINLFYVDNEGRYAIEPTDNHDEFRLKGKRQKFTTDEILQLIDKSPESFSPNVLLRPICQDKLFPTLCYIGGPGEISYFAQLMPLYNLYQITQPILYPRASATILENSVSKLTEKYKLNITDFFTKQNELINQIIANTNSFNLEDISKNLADNINNNLDVFSGQILSIDKTLLDNINKTKDNINHSLKILTSKVFEAQKRKDDVTVRQLIKAHNFVYPNEVLQEREIAWIYFINKYGKDRFMSALKSICINKFEHQIINI